MSLRRLLIALTSVVLLASAAHEQGRGRDARAGAEAAAAMTAGHFIFIPSVLLIGVIIGWVLGSRAAQDAFATELKRRDERAAKVRSEK